MLQLPTERGFFSIFVWGFFHFHFCETSSDGALNHFALPFAAQIARHAVLDSARWPHRAFVGSSSLHRAAGFMVFRCFLEVQKKENERNKKHELYWCYISSLVGDMSVNGLQSVTHELHFFQ